MYSRPASSNGTSPHLLSRFTGFFIGIMTGVLANALGILYFVPTLFQSLYKATHSVVKTILLFPFVLIAMAPFFIVMAPFALLYSIKKAIELGAYQGFFKALCFPWDYHKEFQKSITSAGDETFRGTPFFSAMMNHLFLPFLVPMEIVRPVRPVERSAGNDRSARRGFKPFSGTSNSLGSDSNATVRQAKLPLSSLAIGYENKKSDAIGEESKFEKSHLKQERLRAQAELRANAYNNRNGGSAATATANIVHSPPQAPRR